MRLLFCENIAKSFVFCHLLNALVTVSYHGENSQMKGFISITPLGFVLRSPFSHTQSGERCCSSGMWQLAEEVSCMQH